jgi:tetratricopeptide (TPR) repeat protein
LSRLALIYPRSSLVFNHLGVVSGDERMLLRAVELASGGNDSAAKAGYDDDDYLAVSRVIPVYNLALVYIKQERYEEARSQLEDVLRGTDVDGHAEFRKVVAENLEGCSSMMTIENDSGGATEIGSDGGSGDASSGAIQRFTKRTTVINSLRAATQKHSHPELRYSLSEVLLTSLRSELEEEEEERVLQEVVELIGDGISLGDPERGKALLRRVVAYVDYGFDAAPESAAVGGSLESDDTSIVQPDQPAQSAQRASEVLRQNVADNARGDGSVVNGTPPAQKPPTKTTVDTSATASTPTASTPTASTSATSTPAALPSLFIPDPKSPDQTIPPTAASYMKLANAYIDKQEYNLAVNQFKKVLKKNGEYLPALIGFATFGGGEVGGWINASLVAYRLEDADTARALFDKGIDTSMDSSMWKADFELMKTYAWSEEIMARVLFELGSIEEADAILKGGLKKMLEVGLSDGSVWLTADVVGVLGEEHELVKGEAVKKKGGAGVGAKKSSGGLGASSSVFEKRGGEEEEGREEDALQKLAANGGGGGGNG